MAFFLPPAARAGAIPKNRRGQVLSIRFHVDLCGHAIFSSRVPLRIMETDRSLLGESPMSFLSHRECMEEEYEYANKFGKQGI